MKKSAGILIYRKKNGKIQIFLVHPGGPFWKNKDLNSWSIPKGEIAHPAPEQSTVRGSPESVLRTGSGQADIDAIYPNDDRIKYPKKEQNILPESSDRIESTRIKRPNDDIYPNKGPNENEIFGEHSGNLFGNNSGSKNTFGQDSGNNLNPHKSALLNTALREFEEETGIVLTDEDKEKIFYLGEVKSKNKIVYVFALEKDLGDKIEIKSNLVKTEFGEFPEVDKGEYFDLEVAREKLVSYQKELVDMIKFI
jgi:predicted NUDIX family NTP pyrophosphohydrolase